MNRRSLVGGYVVAGVGVAAVAAVALLVSPSFVFGPLEWLAAHPVRFGAALVALAAIRPFLAWPNTLLAVAVGYGYGWTGLPLGIALLTLTALPAYRLARAGRSQARAALPAADRLFDASERFATATGGVRAVAAMRLFPIPSDAVSVGAGVADVRTRPFLLGTAVGELPWVVVGIAVGVSLDRLAAGGLSAVDPIAIVAMAGIGALLLSGPLYRTFLGEQSGSAV